jgi:dTDP-4-dehydrorhamnose reductase
MITGSSGLLGRGLVDILRNDYEVVGVDKQPPTDENSKTLDITEKQRTVEVVVGAAPHVVVHTAAETNVDTCETDRDLARRINVDGTANIAEACAKAGARLMLISTDYVFDGASGNYTETDLTNPINFYGLTKLQAERIAETLPTALIIRTSVLYGWHPDKSNFATWILKGLRERQSLRVAEDHVNSPTFNRNLAEAIKSAIGKGSQGVLHVAGRDKVSRFDFARRIAEVFDLDSRLLVPVKMSDLNWIAPRPRDSSLRVEKAEKELGIQLFGVDRGLEEMVRSGP